MSYKIKLLIQYYTPNKDSLTHNPKYKMQTKTAIFHLEETILSKTTS